MRLVRRPPELRAEILRTCIIIVFLEPPWRARDLAVKYRECKRRHFRIQLGDIWGRPVLTTPRFSPCWAHVTLSREPNSIESARL